MTDPVKITAAAAIVVSIIQAVGVWITSRAKDKINEVHDIAVRVETQTNDRLSALMKEVSDLKAKISDTAVKDAERESGTPHG
jgi:uncharacterized membrane protein affecting hemolysin expression